jgi:RNA polymerase sigma-70 factor, ECF subfamily
MGGVREYPWVLRTGRRAYRETGGRAYHGASLWQGYVASGDNRVDSEIRLLVRAAQGGDREAFGELYERLAPGLYRYFYHRTNRSAEVAEDLTEDVFVKIMGRLDRYEDRGLPFTAWVYQVARNLAVDYVRRQPPHGAVSMDSAPELVEPSREGTIEQALHGCDLDEVLAALTAAQREVLTLRFLQDLSVRETAQVLGRTEDAIKKLQERGLAQSRRVLSGRPLGRCGRVPLEAGAPELASAA